MKNLLLFSFLAIGVFASCGDDNNCSQSDFIGTWIGTEDCDLLAPEDVIITITAVGTDRLLLDGGRFDTDEVEINNCSVSENNTIFGIGWEYSGDLTGTNLTLEHKAVGGGTLDVTCEYTLTKQ